jgi:AcrR family transcriptional regulator
MITTAPARPSGREQVTEAIVEATLELAAELPPWQVTVRGIADRAGIKHPEIHRYFGTKEALFLEIARESVLELQELDDASIDELIAYVLEKKGAVRIAFTRAVEGEASAAGSADMLRSIGRKVAPLSEGENDVWAAGTVMVAAMMGWALLEDWFHAANPDADLSRSRAHLNELLNRMAAT